MILRWKQTRPGGVVHEPAMNGDFGYDLESVEHVVLMPGEMRDIALGVAVELPLGKGAWITHRSSAPRKLGITGHLGAIDNGYRGDLFLLAENVTEHSVVIEPGMRIAQLVLFTIVNPLLEQVDELAGSERGAKGFGSTGIGAGRS